MHSVKALLCFVLLSGCYTVRVQAPPGVEVVLAERSPSSTSGAGGNSTDRRHWFLVNGLVSLNDNTTVDLVPKDCAKVGFVTEMTGTDALINIGFGLLSAATWTAVAIAAQGGATDAAFSNAQLGIDLTSLLLIPQTRTTTAICYERRSPTPQPGATSQPSASPQPTDRPLASMIRSC